MIKAINKAGLVTEFTETVWNLMTEKKNGFVELGENSVSVSVPKEIVEFKAKKAELPKVEKEEKPTVEIVNTKGDANGEMEIMKEALKLRGIKFHHMAGYDKIKKLYDESSK